MAYSVVSTLSVRKIRYGLGLMKHAAKRYEGSYQVKLFLKSSTLWSKKAPHGDRSKMPRSKMFIWMSQQKKNLRRFDADADVWTFLRPSRRWSKSLFDWKSKRHFSIRKPSLSKETHWDKNRTRGLNLLRRLWRWTVLAQKNLGLMTHLRVCVRVQVCVCVRKCVWVCAQVC